VGLDHIDLKSAAKNISIGYTPGVNADATAEITMLLMIGAARRAYEGQELVRTQAWTSTSPPILGRQLSGKSLGILGMGRIGQAVAKRARRSACRSTMLTQRNYLKTSQQTRSITDLSLRCCPYAIS